MNHKEQNEILERLSKNPKIIKAMKGVLSPLEQEDDTLTIITSKEEDK